MHAATTSTTRTEKFSVLDFSFYFRLLTVSFFVSWDTLRLGRLELQDPGAMLLLVAGMILRVIGSALWLLYAICGCEKFAFVWRSELLQWMPPGYHGELCEECCTWTG